MMEHTQSYNAGNVQSGAEIWAAAKPEWSNKDVSTRRPDMREGMQMVGVGKNSTALKSCVAQLKYLIRESSHYPKTCHRTSQRINQFSGAFIWRCVAPLPLRADLRDTVPLYDVETVRSPKAWRYST
jgi:hypothetical protein